MAERTRATRTMTDRPTNLTWASIVPLLKLPPAYDATWNTALPNIMDCPMLILHKGNENLKPMFVGRLEFSQKPGRPSLAVKTGTGQHKAYEDLADPNCFSEVRKHLLGPDA